MVNPIDELNSLKCKFLIMNIAILLSGLLLLILGFKPLLNMKSFDTFLEPHHYGPAELMAAIGVSFMILLIIGLLGLFSDSTMLLKIYYCFTFPLMVLELFTGLAAFHVGANLVDIERIMLNSFNNYTKNEVDQTSWDFIQHDLHCCGLKRPYDWTLQDISGHPVAIDGQMFVVPTSCCDNNLSSCFDIYKVGCVQALQNYVWKVYVWIGYAAFGITVMELITVMIAFVLFSAIHTLRTPCQ